MVVKTEKVENRETTLNARLLLGVRDSSLIDVGEPHRVAGLLLIQQESMLQVGNSTKAKAKKENSFHDANYLRNVRVVTVLSHFLTGHITYKVD